MTTLSLSALAQETSKKQDYNPLSKLQKQDYIAAKPAASKTCRFKSSAPAPLPLPPPPIACSPHPPQPSIDVFEASRSGSAGYDSTVPLADCSRAEAEESAGSGMATAAAADESVDRDVDSGSGSDSDNEDFEFEQDAGVDYCRNQVRTVVCIILHGLYCGASVVLWHGVHIIVECTWLMYCIVDSTLYCFTVYGYW